MTPKVYRRVGEVASELGVKHSVVRYWCKRLGFRRRSQSGQRLLVAPDVEKLRRLVGLMDDGRRGEAAARVVMELLPEEVDVGERGFDDDMRFFLEELRVAFEELVAECVEEPCSTSRSGLKVL